MEKHINEVKNELHYLLQEKRLSSIEFSQTFGIMECIYRNPLTNEVFILSFYPNDNRVNWFYKCGIQPNSFHLESPNHSLSEIPSSYQTLVSEVENVLVGIHNNIKNA